MPPASIWVGAIISGLSTVMMASGLILVFSIMGILNWTHGQFYMIGAMIVYYAIAFGVNYFPALLVAGVVVAIIGVGMEKWLLRPLIHRGEWPSSVICLGLIFLFDGIVVAIAGPGLKSVPTVVEGVLHIGPVSVSMERLVLAGVSVVILLGLYFLVSRTKVGLAIRASAQDLTIASLFGVRIGLIRSIVMAIGCGLAAIAGGLMAPVYYINLEMGTRPFITALLAIVLGGLGSFRGAVIGGMLLGFVAIVIGYYIGAWNELVAFFAVILIILFRPQGLFGEPPARV